MWRTVSLSALGRCLKGFFTSVRFFGVLLEKLVEIQQSFLCWGTAEMCSFQVDEWTQWEQCNDGIVYRGKKLLAPERALLHALRCLDFLLMASCMSQLPDAFPRVATGCILHSHLGNSWLYFCIIMRAPTVRSMAEKRQCLLGKNASHLIKWWHD